MENQQRMGYAAKSKLPLQAAVDQFQNSVALVKLSTTRNYRILAAW